MDKCKLIGFIISFIFLVLGASMILVDVYSFKYRHDLTKCSNVSLNYYNNDTCFHVNCLYIDPTYHQQSTFSQYCCDNNMDSYNCKQNYKNGTTTSVYIFAENKSLTTLIFAIVFMCFSVGIFLGSLLPIDMFINRRHVYE